MKKTLHTRSFIAQAWGLFKKYWKFIIPAGIATFAVSMIVQFILPTDAGWVLVLLNYIIGTAISLALSLGWAQLLLRIARGGSPVWSDFKTQPRVWGKYFVAQLLVSLVMIICFGIIIGISLLGMFTGSGITLVIGVLVMIAAIIALIWFSLRMSFLVFIVVDHSDLGIIAMLKKAFTMTRGNVWTLIKLSFWQVLVILLGLIALVVGLVVAVPVIYIASVCMYEYIKSGKKSEHGQDHVKSVEAEELPA